MTVNVKRPKTDTVERTAAFVAQQATRSLLYEVSITPKPGLVDRIDSGAHTDMDFFTYLDSSVALTEYFRLAYLESRVHSHLPAPELFSHLRELGLQAEQQMYEATGGVNTHKGSIFTLGLLCGGLGCLAGRGIYTNEANLLHLCSQMVTPAFTAELNGMDIEAAKTGGERYYAVTGFAGIRGEAVNGYPSLLHCGLPALRRALSQGHSMNDAGIIVLLELMCCVHDSNLFVRCGAEKQQQLAYMARDILDDHHLDLGRVAQLNEKCVRDRASPGGCADLLAATFFLYFYFSYPRRL